MSKKKSAGKLIQRTRPRPKFLGVKVSDGQKVSIGEVLVRQRGTKYVAGRNVKVGRDHTLFSVAEGRVKFGSRTGKKMVSVVEENSDL
jgi:large subunit ribosomal protein L27